MLMLPLEPIEAGEFCEWPLHCTLLPWFRTRLGGSEVVHVVNGVCSSYTPVSLCAQHTFWLEGEQNVSARAIQKTNRLMKIHRAMADAIRAGGAAFDEQRRILDGYEPYVANQPHAELRGQTNRIVREVAVVEWNNNGTLVLQSVIPFGQR
jgi:hypothetical protein